MIAFYVIALVDPVPYYRIAIAGVKRSIPSRHVAMATNMFLNNTNDPSNHHAKFEIFLSYT